MLNGELKKKVIFVTGKGGVGKSTITSAIACHLAEEGRKVLVIDADPEAIYPKSKKLLFWNLSACLLKSAKISKKGA